MKRPKLKKASKRLTCHKRYKIQKKIREHHRKVRKEAKKRGRKKPKKDPGVPSAAPFKEELLREAEQRKQRLEELKQKQKLNRQKEHEKKRKLEAKKNAAKVKEKAEGKESSGKSKAKTNKLLDKNSKKSFCRELKKVIEASDVVLEVLDARDPMGCRCPQLEQAVTCSGGDKKLLLVLNKIDLVPKENLEKWLHYLKKEFPTVAFKSATLMKDRTMQEQFKKRRARVDLSRTTECFGSKCLLKLLQQHGKTQNKAIQVGVVGFPNVGKSSIINSLKGVRACNVGLARGVTKSMQIVHIDKQTKMLDSPSIIADPSNSALALALRSIIDTEESDSADVLEGVDAILNHCSKQQVMMHYSIPDFKNTEEFLTLLAQKRGMLKKGGVPDIENIAKLLLCDWTGAKISYHSQPPVSQRPPPYLTEDKIAEMQECWNLKNLEEENTTTVQALKYPSPASSIIFQSPGMANGTIEENKVIEEASEWENLETGKKGEEEEEEEDFTESEDDQDDAEEEEKDVKEETKVQVTRKAKLGKQQTSPTNSEKQIAESEHSNSLSLSLDKTADEDDAYDFNTDYV
ncbi:guanine nucleotide-binding protein-like 3 isoform X1 [Aquila chrysaetos chrysaetos]|uniref:Guanine nucleotide-binding protein-like 3 n=1 Tax=Aquila chrysaetos chrysaetos TaxID=223781 RepID=A0A663F984_AQUCH|nr:guanine nucleotide-binding protein-like 3 isoform X1 [Aquila chrysaetos chrysaetos]